MSENGSRDFRGRVREEAREVLLDDIAGRKQWRGSKLGYVTGVSMLTGMVSGAFGTVASSAGRVKSMFSAATKVEDNSDLPEIDATEEDPARRFELALAAHGKDEADLAAMARNSHRGFLFYACLLLAVTVIGIASLRYGNITGLPWLIDTAVRFGTVPALAALMLRFGYLNWIVRKRRLGGLREYLLSGEIFPVKALARSAAAAMAAFVLAGLVLGADPAMAAPPAGISKGCDNRLPSATPSPSDLFGKPHCDDVFSNMLGFIAPGVGPVMGTQTEAHKAIATGFTAFSGVLMFFGSMMLGWHVLAGIVASAYSGKVLGERWHQIWAPSRVVLGLGSLAPVAGGYGAAQVLVILLVMAGGNLANAIWRPYVSVLAGGIVSPIGPYDPSKKATKDAQQAIFKTHAGAESVVKNIFLLEVCNAIGTKVYENETGGGQVDGKLIRQAPKFEQVGRDRPENNDALFSSFANLFRKESEQSVTVMVGSYAAKYGQACGQVELSVRKMYKDEGAGGTSRNAFHARAAIQFDNARKTALEAVMRDVRTAVQPLAATYAVGGDGARAFSETESTRSILNELPGKLQTIAQNYSDTMVGAAQIMQEELDTNGDGKSLVKTLVEETFTKGWATAGTYYVTLAQVQGAVYSRAMQKPEFSKNDLGSMIIPTALYNALVGNEVVPGALQSADVWWDSNVRTEFREIDPLSAKAGRSTEMPDNWFNSMMEAIGTDFIMTKGLGMFKDLDPYNPMKSMIDFGHFILNLFWAFMMIIAAVGVVATLAKMPLGGVAGAAGTISKFGGLVKGMSTDGGLMGVLVTFLTMLFMGLFAVGIVHAYIIPMIPYIQVLFFLAGMLVLVVEALIAAPLWAFFHMRMDGQELVDQVQRPGYMIAFNLLLRPSLMILGLMMSMFVFGGLAWFISKTITVAAVAAGSDHSVGPIGTIVMISIVCYLHYQIALRSFGLINQVPDRVTRWFGQGGENLRESDDNDKAVAFGVMHLANRSGDLVKGAVASGKIDSATKRRPNMGKKSPLPGGIGSTKVR